MLSLPAIEQAVNIPLLHVAQSTADAVKKQGMDTVGLLGTRFTMSDGFYTDFMETQGVNYHLHRRRTGRNPPHYFRRTLQKPNPAQIRPLFLRRNQPPQTGRRGRHHLRLHRNLPD